MVNDFWLKNKHTISIFQAQVRDLAKHIEAQPKKHNAYKKKHISTLTKICTNTKKNFGTKRKKQVISESLIQPKSHFLSSLQSCLIYIKLCQFVSCHSGF